MVRTCSLELVDQIYFAFGIAYNEFLSGYTIIVEVLLPRDSATNPKPIRSF